MSERVRPAAGSMTYGTQRSPLAWSKYDRSVPEPTAELRAPKAGTHAEGFEAAQANCLVCHSVDYIAMQPPGKGAAFWESEVTKMVKVYHAPIDAAQAKAIAAYLADTY